VASGVWIQQPHWTPLKLGLVFLASLLLTMLWGAVILPTDAQAGIAFIVWLPVIPAAVCLALGFFEQRQNRRATGAALATVGCLCPMVVFGGLGAPLFCVTSGGAIVLFLAGLLGGAIGTGIGSMFYEISISDGKRCLQCGYPLIGLESDVCPECGWIIDYRMLGATKEALRKANLEEADES